MTNLMWFLAGAVAYHLYTQEAGNLPRLPAVSGLGGFGAAPSLARIVRAHGGLAPLPPARRA